ncbi:hypothetical protein [Egbenema bharatensis]|uniref:hypothetical protein n=1 Tax=Egbenema bharatensis TaxID=3463334 RepID=UPI003A8C6EE0
MLSKVIPSHSIKAFRYRVHVLEKDLWKEQNPRCRANLAMQLADAATTLARLEMREAQRYQLLDASDSMNPGVNVRVDGRGDAKVNHTVERDDGRDNTCRADQSPPSPIDRHHDCEES